MTKNQIDDLVLALEKAGAGLCPVTGQPITDTHILASRVAYYDLARHLKYVITNSIELTTTVPPESNQEGTVREESDVVTKAHAPVEAAIIQSAKENCPSPDKNVDRKSSAKNSGKPWVDQDLSTCLSMYHDQFSFLQIAQKIGRTPWSVAIKLNQLGELGDEAFERLKIEYGKADPIGTKRSLSK